MIRQMQKEDAEYIAAIESRLFGTPWSEKSISDCIDNDLYYCYVIEENAQPVGYICLMAVVGEMELLRIGVESAHQRKGYADSLMGRMLLLADELATENIFLEVRSKNEPAISLYRKYGFVPEGVRKKYYHNPEDDAVIMWRRKE